MPSARPRLVQEGTPLDQEDVANDGAYHRLDHHMEDAASNNNDRRGSNVLQQPRHDISSAPRSSSLALAAGMPAFRSTGSQLKINQVKTHSNRSHRYVVGQEDEMEIAKDHVGVDPYGHASNSHFNQNQHSDRHRSYYPSKALPHEKQIQDTSAAQLFGPVQTFQPVFHTATSNYAEPDSDKVTHHNRYSEGQIILPPSHSNAPETHSPYNSPMPIVQSHWSPSMAYENSYQNHIPPTATNTASAHLERQRPATSGRHHYRIGASEMEQALDEDDDIIERMYGIEDHSVKPPLIVIDGANLAFAYSEAMAGGSTAATSSLSYYKKQPQIEPNVHGIQVAVSYFQSAGCRVLVVLPTWWLRLKPRGGDAFDSNAKTQTPQLEILQELKAQGVLVTSPPKDDDDAYALTIARREDARARHASQQYQQGPSGFVLSNDMFRDAMARDTTGQLATWLTQGAIVGGVSYPGRISYAFCDMGSMDGYGDPELDVVPNPKHPIVMQIEAAIHQQFFK